MGLMGFHLSWVFSVELGSHLGDDGSKRVWVGDGGISGTVFPMLVAVEETSRYPPSCTPFDYLFCNLFHTYAQPSNTFIFPNNFVRNTGLYEEHEPLRETRASLDISSMSAKRHHNTPLMNPSFLLGQKSNNIPNPR